MDSTAKSGATDVVTPNCSGSVGKNSLEFCLELECHPLMSNRMA